MKKKSRAVFDLITFKVNLFTLYVPLATPFCEHQNVKTKDRKTRVVYITFSALNK